MRNWFVMQWMKFQFICFICVVYFYILYIYILISIIIYNSHLYDIVKMLRFQILDILSQQLTKFKGFVCNVFKFLAPQREGKTRTAQHNPAAHPIKLSEAKYVFGWLCTCKSYSCKQLFYLAWVGKEIFSTDKSTFFEI